MTDGSKDVPVKATLQGTRAKDITLRASLRAASAFDVPLKATMMARTSKDVSLMASLEYPRVDYGLYGVSSYESQPRSTFFFAQDSDDPNKSISRNDPYWITVGATSEGGVDGAVEIGIGQSDDQYIDGTDDVNIPTFFRGIRNNGTTTGYWKMKPLLWFVPGSQPTAGEQEGMIYYDSSSHSLKYRDDTTWQTLTTGSGMTAHDLTGSYHTEDATGGTGNVIVADSATTFSWQQLDYSELANTPSTMTPSAHQLDSATYHTVSGLTTGHFLKATGTTTFGFTSHGLTAADVGAISTTTYNAHDHSSGDPTQVDYTDLTSIPSSFTPSAHAIGTAGGYHSGTLPLSDLAESVYTQTQTDSAIDTDIATHAAITDAHHAKYALTEDLTSGEITQLQNIDTSTILTTQWGYLGELDQSLLSSASPSFVSLTLSNDLLINTTASHYITLYSSNNDTAPGLFIGNDATDRLQIRTHTNAGTGQIDYVEFTTASTGAGATDGRMSFAPDNVTSLTLNPNGSHSLVGDISVTGTVDGVDISDHQASLADHTDVTVSGAYLEDLLMFGSGNKAWVPAIYTTDVDMSTSTIGASNMFLRNTSANDSYWYFDLPLPTVKGALKLYVDDVKVLIQAADVNDYITGYGIYGLTYTTGTEIDADATDKQAQEEVTYSFTATDCSGYDIIRIFLRTEDSGGAAGQLQIAGVLVGCYYDT